MKTRTRRLLIILGIFVVLGLTIFLVYWFAFRNTLDKHVVRLSGISGREPSEFRNSLFQMHPGGAFNIEIILGEAEVIFVGIGTWERGRNEDGKQVVNLTFFDAWGLYGLVPTFTQNPTSHTGQPFIGNTIPYEVYRSGIRFITHDHWVFYFN